MSDDLIITVDPNRCVGSTMCVQAADTVFALDVAGQSTVIDASGADADVIIDAAAECPMEAVTVADGSGVQLFP